MNTEKEKLTIKMAYLRRFYVASLYDGWRHSDPISYQKRHNRNNWMRSTMALGVLILASILSIPIMASAQNLQKRYRLNGNGNYTLPYRGSVEIFNTEVTMPQHGGPYSITVSYSWKISYFGSANLGQITISAVANDGISDFAKDAVTLSGAGTAGLGWPGKSPNSYNSGAVVPIKITVTVVQPGISVTDPVIVNEMSPGSASSGNIPMYSYIQIDIGSDPPHLPKARSASLIRCGRRSYRPYGLAPIACSA